MIKTREALLGIAVGKKGVGKTYETLNIVSGYLRGNPRAGVRPRPVLILDVNNEYANARADHGNPLFPNIKTIALEHVKLVPKQKPNPKTGHAYCYRVAPFKNDGTPMSIDEVRIALTTCLNDFRNGLFIIEDINKIISDSMPNDLMGRIVTQRHDSVDIITHFQTLGKAAHPKLWGNCNYLRFHKCEDTVAKNKDKLKTNVDGLLILEELVNYEYVNGNPRFNAYYDKDRVVVKGRFSKEQFAQAVERFLQKNPSIVKREANKIHVLDKGGVKAGTKIHKSVGDAGAFLLKSYVDEYYGNPDGKSNKKIVRKKK